MEQSRLSEIQLGITAAAIAGDSGSVYRIVANLLDMGTPFETVLFDILLRSERDVGLRWQAGDYLVAEEHAATATLETVIALLTGSLDQPANGSVVVVATAPGDSHSRQLGRWPQIFSIWAIAPPFSAPTSWRPI
jgi:methanogenic corrinoid protein MtbC1